MLKYLNLLFQKKKNPSGAISIIPEDQSKRLNIQIAAQRVTDSKKSDLIFDPIGFEDWVWYAKTKKNELKTLISKKYIVNKAITYNMPKSSLTYRPITCLLPSDSIIYQALVDRIIEYKKDKFSKQVFSNILLDVNKKEVFDKPVYHWLEMRKNIRRCVKHGNDFYFFCDIASCFENVKINKLCSILEFYVGRNEIKFINTLKQLLVTWQFADSQGIIQPHNASSILCKIYLSKIDSSFSQMGKNYNRYVDEFHILSSSKRDILKASLSLSIALRNLGMNLNSSKSIILHGADYILNEVSEDNDFFDSVNYLRDVKHDFQKADEKIIEKYNEFVSQYLLAEKVNMKILRFCIRKFAHDKNPIAIDFCLSMIEGNFEQIVDITKYLSVFVNNVAYNTRIIDCIVNYLKSTERNLYAWVQVWFLELIYNIEDRDLIPIEFIYSIAINKEIDDLSRSLAFLILSKHLEDHELQYLPDFLKTETSIIIIRTLLFCCSKLPKTSCACLYELNENDCLDIIVAKEYLKNNQFVFNTVI